MECRVKLTERMKGLSIALFKKEEQKLGKSRDYPLLKDRQQGVSEFVCSDALLPNQQFFSNVRTSSCLPGLNLNTKQWIKCQ